MLRVVFNANCNGNVTLSQKNIPCGDFEGSPSATALRPDPADLISNPLEYFENVCTDTHPHHRTRELPGREGATRLPWISCQECGAWGPPREPAGTVHRCSQNPCTHCHIWVGHPHLPHPSDRRAGIAHPVRRACSVRMLKGAVSLQLLPL